MEGGRDFIEFLGSDVSMKILKYLEDPSDLVRACAVSSSWRQFVVANGISKLLCLKIFPEIAHVSYTIDKMIEPVEFKADESVEWACLKYEHMVYAHLARGLASNVREDCLNEAISASSTDNYPQESIQNTLEPNDRVGRRASYWSSKGEKDAGVPETLTYNLMSKLCLITEIHVQPFQAYFQFGYPIYSAKSVRFLMGHSTSNMEQKSDNNESSSAQESSHENYVWTYVSPEFSMAQENCMQKFRLPEPVLCIGGILQVQLLGRVQKQEMDNLYYVCISHVQVLGRPLTTEFDVEILDQSGKWRLRHCPGQQLGSSFDKRSSHHRASSPSRFHRLTASITGWEQMIITVLGLGVEGGDDE